ncbi:alpha/beta fold hydrolase [Neomegalonema perideroedes]|uniref:alpha/beta fold hydrolase n=1 Tax=Neomegalonema perideroedes TaxID=217219 RepID=UPI00037D7D65|nr:alpha/beta fold hydrolase [Neomegalonema perideroedes]
MIPSIPLAFARQPSEAPGTPGAPPFVVAHGLYGSARNWGSLARAFARKRETIAADLRGHGDSPRAYPISYAAMAADLGALIAREAGGVADVLGHSMGGKVVMTLALTQPERIRRLIVADIAPKTYENPQQADYARALLALDLGSLTRRSEADKLLAEVVPEAAVRAFLLSNLVGSQAEGWRWRADVRGLLEAMPGILGWAPPEGAKPFEGETLVLTGGESSYVRPEDREGILALFPRARFQSLAGAGHWLHADKPTEFREAVEAFLA